MTKSSQLYKPSDIVIITLLASFALLTAYRFLFTLPVWFDEFVVKAVMFGLPALILAPKLGVKDLGIALGSKFWQGLYWGLFLGGFYVFVLTLSSWGQDVQPHLVSSPSELFSLVSTALVTGWWESLFFFTFVLQVLMCVWKKKESSALGIAVLIFLVFHLPARIVAGGTNMMLLAELFTLAVFALGQGILFLRTKSVYAVTISHALWGLALMAYTASPL